LKGNGVLFRLAIWKRLKRDNQIGYGVCNKLQAIKVRKQERGGLFAEMDCHIEQRDGSF